jgi:hypothetical protein
MCLRVSYLELFFSRICVTPANKSCDSKPTQVSFCAAQCQGLLAVNPAPAMTASPSISRGFSRVIVWKNSLVRLMLGETDLPICSSKDRLNMRSAMEIMSNSTNKLGILDAVLFVFVIDSLGGYSLSQTAIPCRVLVSCSLRAIVSLVDIFVEHRHIGRNLCF